MLYGSEISETVTVGAPDAAVPVTVEVRGVQRPPLNRRATTDKLKAINKDVHQTIRFPNNFMDLPDLLANRVWALILERKKSEAKRSRHLEKLPDKYRRMALDAREAVQLAGEEQPSYLSYYRCLGPVLGQHQTGNCGEYSALVVNRLLVSVPQERIKLLRGALGEENNHVCVVVDAAPDAEPADWRSYGSAAIVCDPWLDLVALPGEYFRVLRVIDCEFGPNALNNLADRAG